MYQKADELKQMKVLKKIETEPYIRNENLHSALIVPIPHLIASRKHVYMVRCSLQAWEPRLCGAQGKGTKAPTLSLAQSSHLGLCPTAIPA